MGSFCLVVVFAFSAFLAFRAVCARFWACFRVTVSRVLFTWYRALGVMERLFTPSPISITARAGSAAASPHTPTGFLCFFAPCTVVCISFSTAGCQELFSVASVPSWRSAAMVYWVRSLVPMLTKSAVSQICCASMAAAGTSIITPAWFMPISLHSLVNSSVSVGVDIMGAMTQTFALLFFVAWAIAWSWFFSMFGLVLWVR